MTDDVTNLPAVNNPAPAPAEPPEDLAGLVRQYPGLVLAGGVAIGLIAGALIPRKAGGRLVSRAVSLASVAGEIGLALSQSARDKAEDAAREGRARLAELGESPAITRARASGADARRAGMKLARKALEAATKRAVRKSGGAPSNAGSGEAPPSAGA